MKYQTTFTTTISLAIAACVSTSPDVPRERSASPAGPTGTATAPSLTAANTVGLKAAEKEDAAATGDDHHDHAVPAPSSLAAPAPAAGSRSASQRPEHAPSVQAASPTAAAVWTCSMHPEIAMNGPGQCPVCGMNLIKRPIGKDAH